METKIIDDQNRGLKISGLDGFIDRSNGSGWDKQPARQTSAVRLVFKIRLRESVVEGISSIHTALDSAANRRSDRFDTSVPEAHGTVGRASQGRSLSGSLCSLKSPSGHVTDAAANREAERASIEGDTDVIVLVQAVKDAGYTAHA